MHMAKAKQQQIGRIDLSKMTIIDVDFCAHVRYDRALGLFFIFRVFKLLVRNLNALLFLSCSIGRTVDRGEGKLWFLNSYQFA